jgi:hypothetical protein
MAETYKPTESMAAAAKRAIKWREDGKATGAGTPVGWKRASQLASRQPLSLDTVKRMYSFFSRHEVDKKGKGFYSGPEFPSNGRIMWDAWGGDAGFSWSRKIVNSSKKKDVQKADSLKVGSMVSWNSSGGRAEGKIVRIVRNGSIDVPDSDFTINGTPEDPAALIRLYRDGKPTDTYVGHKLKTLNAMTSKNSEMDDEDEYPEDEYEGLSERQLYLYDELESMVEEFGPFSKGIGEGGAHYMEENPFAKDGMMCGNCVFYKGAGVCEIFAEGDSVAEEAVCKFWIIPEGKLQSGEPMEKRDYSEAQRKRMALNGQAMGDGSFPIADEADLRNAIQAVGRAKDYEAAKRHIMRRARALGKEDLLPEEWKKGMKKFWNGFFAG